MKIRLERYQPTQPEARVVESEIQPHEIPRIVGEHENDWSTTLELHRAEEALFISASTGRLAVMASSSDGMFYDLVGAAGARGSVEFVHGGQPANHPERHIVSFSQASDAATRFAEGKELGLEDPRWEQQAQFDLAQ
jgi:hypothetical protein